MTHTLRFFCCLPLFALAACAPLAPFEEQDRGPDEPVDLSDVPDAEPRREARTLAGNKSPYTVLGKTYRLMEDETDYREQGIASWYGQKFHGRKTSNGEVYDMYAMTAAHKTLPIPSYVRVTNLDSDRQVIVRVNDRGPFHQKRVIDLSYAAAYRLGFADEGTARVEVEIVVPGDEPPPPLRADKLDPSLSLARESKQYLQVGAYGSRESAEQQRRELSDLVEFPVVIHGSERAQLHRVRIGPLANDSEVDRVREQLRKKAIEQTHIVRE